MIRYFKKMIKSIPFLGKVAVNIGRRFSGCYLPDLYTVDPKFRDIYIERVNHAIIQKRLYLSRVINDHFSGTVGYGPFQGLRFTDDSWWGGGDRAGMLLGIYEKEVLETLTTLSERHEYEYFVDLGAADGYYGIGVVVSGLFEKSYCYEQSEHGRSLIRQACVLNDVSDKKVEVRGLATNDFYKDLPEDVLRSCVLMVDIEGAEFSLLDRSVLHAFRKSTIIVELHEMLLENGDDLLLDLKRRAVEYFSIREITVGSRDLSGFKELENYRDDDRWLICSEGRRAVQRWYIMTPKTPS
ncbi:hypothetical protein [Castellaniella sp.]|uniref:hypothetical protein n=1 Tax=Castellaniella sp. TaxID=1955812 RepID=UPI002AFE410A|nr:hypothetical protein [Castellaniella sp.]